MKWIKQILSVNSHQDNWENKINFNFHLFILFIHFLIFKKIFFLGGGGFRAHDLKTNKWPELKHVPFAVGLGLASSLIFTLATVHCRTDDVILILTFTVEVPPEHQVMVWLSWHSRIWNIEREKITELLIFKNMDNLVYS